MLNINLKQYIREFLNRKMDEARGTSKNFHVSPGILIRDLPDHIEFEMFLDDLWFYMSKRNLEEENKLKNAEHS